MGVCVCDRDGECVSRVIWAISVVAIVVVQIDFQLRRWYASLISISFISLLNFRIFTDFRAFVVDRDVTGTTCKRSAARETRHASFQNRGARAHAIAQVAKKKKRKKS